MIIKFDLLMEQFEEDFEGFLESLDLLLCSDVTIASSEIFELFVFIEKLQEEFEDESTDIKVVVWDAAHEKGYLSTEEFTRDVVDNFGKFGPWYDEILVHVAEASKIPNDLIDWFLNQDIAPFEWDSDLYNQSRTSISGIAANTSTPPEILGELSKSEDWSIKWRIGMNSSTPESALLRLIADTSEDANVIIAGVALNPSSTPEILEKIIHLDNSDLRTLATKNKNCTSDLIKIAEQLGLVKRPFNNWGLSLAWMLQE